jgi:peptidylprolyl isomerase/foldase protein PrsA
VPTLTEDTFQTAYQAFLNRASLTDQAYRDLVRAEVDRDKLREAMKADIPPTEEQVHARHILVDNQESLQKVQEQLAQGVPFDQVARENSTDPGSRDKGGDLGWFGRGAMNAPFEAAAFSQTIGEVGPPVESPNGTHIVQVLERDPNRALSSEQVERQSSQAYQAWLAGVRGGSDVRNDMTPEKRAWVLRQLGPQRR